MNSQKPQNIFEAKTYTGVRQDKSAPLVDRSASEQGYRLIDKIRLNKERIQSNLNKETLVPLTTQIRPSVKAEIERAAKQEALSVSAVAGALLERSVQTQIDMQYGTLLEPVIKDQIRQGIQAYSNRTASLLIKAHRSAEQARLIAIRLLSLLLNGNQEIISRIVEEARIEAQANVLRHLEEDKENQN